jgi:hypothetical protein
MRDAIHDFPLDPFAILFPDDLYLSEGRMEDFPWLQNLKTGCNHSLDLPDLASW